jgi:hypothetical protein
MPLTRAQALTLDWDERPAIEAELAFVQEFADDETED